MFKNIGEKVKGLAEGLFSVLFIIAVLFALKMLEEDIFSSILILGLGFLGAWCATAMIYAFGELVDNSSKTVSLLQEVRYLQRYGVDKKSNDKYDEYDEYDDYDE